MRHREGAESHEGLRHGDLGQLRQLDELGRGVRRDGAAADVQHRPLGPHERPRGLLDLPGMPFVRRVVGAHVHFRRILEGPLLDEDVLRQVHVHGSGTAGGRDVKRLLDDVRQVLAVLDQEVVLGRRARDADIVRFLERVVADQVRRHLPGERDDGDRVHQRILERGDQVRGGGSGRDEADADLARRARVALRRMARRGLLPHEDVANALKVVEDVVDRQHRPAGQAKDEVDPFPLQALQQNPRARELHHLAPPCPVRRVFSRLFDLGVGRRQPRDGHHECRARHVVHAHAMAELHRRRIAAVLAADAHLEVRHRLPAALDADPDQLAHPFLVEHRERIEVAESSSRGRRAGTCRCRRGCSRTSSG